MLFKQFYLLKEVEVKDELHDFAINKSEINRLLNTVPAESKSKYDDALLQIDTEFENELSSGANPEVLHRIKAKLVSLKGELMKSTRVRPNPVAISKPTPNAKMTMADYEKRAEKSAQPKKSGLEKLAAKLQASDSVQSPANLVVEPTQINTPSVVSKPQVTQDDKLNNLATNLDKLNSENPGEIPPELYGAAKQAIEQYKLTKTPEAFKNAIDSINAALDF